MQFLPVVITGLGLCTPLGEGPAATWNALLAGEFINDHARALGDYAQPRVVSLARRAARQAVAEAGWGEEELREAALVVGTSKGPIESWLDAPSLSVTSGSRQFSWGLAEIATEIAGAIGLRAGPRLTLSTACASGLHALIRAAMLIHEGHRRALVVAAESSLHPLFVGSFKRLGVLAGLDVGCRPFDLNREGFLVSEAAAAVCLERAEGKEGVRIERFALGGDATHLTGGDPDGKTLRWLLARVINGRPIDLIHAHGTGTVANDAMELAAIEASLTENDHPALYSHKGALGHSLGAAGLIGVVLNCLCHRNGMVPPNVRTTQPLATRNGELSNSTAKRRVRRSLAVASGFGGASAVVSLIRE